MDQHSEPDAPLETDDRMINTNRNEEDGRQSSVRQSKVGSAAGADTDQKIDEVELAEEESAKEDKEDVPKVELPIMVVEEHDIQEAKNQEAFKHDKNKNIQEIIADCGKVNYLELTHHIQIVHPTVEVPVENKQSPDEKPEKPYRLFYLKEELGFLAPHIPFFCKGKDGEKKVTEMAKQLGPGPTLFLMSTKAFAYLFLILSIINIPVFVFFGTGNAAGEFNRLTDLFAILSMGNVGQSGMACNSFKAQELYENNPAALGYAAKEQLQQYHQASFIFMNCGIGSRIKSLAYFGLAQNSSSSCKNIYDTPDDHAQWFKNKCVYHNSSSNTLFDYTNQEDVRKDQALIYAANKFENKKEEKIFTSEMACYKNLTDDAKPDFVNMWFKCHCVNQSSCKIPGLSSFSDKYQYQWDPKTSTADDVKKGKFLIFDRTNWLGYNYKDECLQMLQEEAQQKDKSPQIIALATCISPTISNPFTGTEFGKEQLGVMIVFFDIITVLGLIIFAQLLLNTQEDYVEAFDMEAIQMIDFTIRVKNLPHHVHYKRRDAILEAMLTQHFQQVIKDELENMRKEAQWMNAQDIDFMNLASDKDDPNKLNPQPYDIADVNFGKAEMTANFLLLKMGKLQNQQTRIQIRKKMLQKNKNACCGPEGAIRNLDKEEVDLNNEFIMLRDEYLQEVQKEKELKNEEQQLLEEEPHLRYAYVTFRSMDAANLVRRSYKRQGSCLRYCIRKCGDKCCSTTLADLNKKNLFKQWPVITDAVTPDNINWQNLGYSERYRKNMKVVNWLIAISMIILSLIFIILLKQRTLELKREYNINVVCPSDASTQQFKEVAWKDQQLVQKDRQGLMHCYCFGMMVKRRMGTKVRDIEFTEFDKFNQTTDTFYQDKTFYCNEWGINYAAQQLAVIGTSLVVVIINIIAGTVLSLSVKIEKNHTVNDETMGQFTKLTILQFINIGLIVLIINFDFTGTNEDGTKKLFLGFLPFFNGVYKDFNSEWFSQIGKTLTLTLLINIFTPHISKLTLPFLKLFTRCMDRNCIRTVWRKKKYDEDIDVNTKLVLQSDINTLYTGDQIASHYVYAQNYTYLCVVLMYSCGLPILYPFAALFYLTLYWVYKGLLLKYYSRTTKFNQEIPMRSLRWVKFGLAMHVFVASLMLSNQNFFPSEKEGDDSYLDDSPFDVPTKGVFFIAYFQRLESGSQSTIYLTFIGLLIMGWLFVVFLDTLLGMFSCLRGPIAYCLKCCTCCNRKNKRVVSRDIFAEFQVAQLNTMYEKAHSDLDEFKKAMEELEAEEKSQSVDIMFKDKRYDQETATDKDIAIRLYERRIRQIELMIDDHLVHLHSEANLHRFAELKPQEKIWYLMDKQQLVDKHQRMRMVDITQSYNIYDSAMFKDAKLVQEHLDDDPTYNLLSDPKAAKEANEAYESAKAAAEAAKAAAEAEKAAAEIEKAAAEMAKEETAKEATANEVE